MTVGQVQPGLNIAFAGSPQFSAAVLAALIRAGFEPNQVYTQPDRPKGRGRKMQPSPVKELALSHGIKVEQPVSFKDSEAQATLKALSPDVLVVVAYGLILPSPVLEIPRFGCINVHASLLPRWRGAAPIERALMAGDKETGCCIMKMDAGLDTGPVYRRSKVAITAKTDILKLEGQLAAVGSEDLVIVLKAFEKARSSGTAPPEPEPQSEAGITYAQKLTALDRVLDCKRPGQTLVNQINALSARMPVRCEIGHKRAQLLSAEIQETDASGPPGTIAELSTAGLRINCATKQLLIKKLKFESGKGTVLDGPAMVNGHSADLNVGATLS
jgi:methionyl-tRNA formyltransferase